MTISLKVIMYLMAAGVGLSSVRGHKGGRENVTDLNDTTTLAENYSLGRNGHFECHYPDSHESNDKFLCKGSSLLNCNWWINATEQEKDVHKGKFHIRDNRRKKYFYVDIGSLSRDDSGTYWCGSSSTAAHVYTKFLLSVTERTEHRHTTRRPDPDPPAVQTTESFKGRDVLHPGGSSEQRRNDEHDTEDDPGDHQYEEIRMLGQQTRPADAPLSVYATVNRPADELHYASVTFQQHRAVVPAEEGGGGGGGRPFAC
ncbi:uncharacterized protein LOC120825754 isoform X2 [Gasterosteus aculeatus]